MKAWLMAAALAIALSVPAYSSHAGAAESPSPDTIRIGNFTFAPAVLEVPAGTSVVFVNEDDVPHTVVGSDRDSPLKSPALDTDDRYSVKLTQPGTYHYFCSLHPHMTGTVIVK
jgi:plastocyanin